MLPAERICSMLQLKMRITSGYLDYRQLSALGLFLADELARGQAETINHWARETGGGARSGGRLTMLDVW